MDPFRFYVYWLIASVLVALAWSALNEIGRHFGTGDPHVRATVQRAERYVAERREDEEPV